MIERIDEVIERVGAGFSLNWPFSIEFRTAPVQFPNGLAGSEFLVASYTAPSMPSGVSAFIPALFWTLTGFGGGFALYKAFDMGNLDIATNAFTDGAAYPTVTELGASNATWGPVFVAYDTALGGTPGTLNFNWTDQDGNAQAAPVGTMAAGPARSGGFANLATVGARDVTGANRSGGAAPTGTVRFYGVVPIAQIVSTGVTAVYAGMYASQLNPVRLDAGDLLLVTASAKVQASGVGGVVFVGDTP